MDVNYSCISKTKAKPCFMIANCQIHCQKRTGKNPNMVLFVQLAFFPANSDVFDMIKFETDDSQANIINIQCI